MRCKEELIQSINPKMKLDKSFFLRVYGYEITYPGFAIQSIEALERAGCSKALLYYERVVADYERKQNEELLPVAKWLHEKVDSEFEKLCRINKGGEGTRKQELLKQKKYLLMKLQEILQKSTEN